MLIVNTNILHSSSNAKRMSLKQKKKNISKRCYQHPGVCGPLGFPLNVKWGPAELSKFKCCRQLRRPGRCTWCSVLQHWDTIGNDVVQPPLWIRYLMSGGCGGWKGSSPLRAAAVITAHASMVHSPSWYC